MMKNLSRKYHPWWEWECYKSGFFSSTPPEGISKEQSLQAYSTFLSSLETFELGIHKVFSEWPVSCEQWLTHTSINRIAWMGQAAMCIHTGIPACFRGGYRLLSVEQQRAADALAENKIKKWESQHENT